MVNGEASPLVASDIPIPDTIHADAHTDLGKAKIENAEIVWYV
jgi:hypothetical protein